MQDPTGYEGQKAVVGMDKVIAEHLPKILDLMTWGPTADGSENLLDYGCGAGSPGFNYILPRLQGSSPVSKMYSVDLSEKMIDYARMNYSHDKIRYAVGNILERFPFPDVQFDKVVAFHVFNQIGDLSNLLRGLHRHMKPGAQLGFATMTMNVLLFRACKALAEDDQWKPYMSNYDQFLPLWSICEEGGSIRKHFVSIVESAGFDVSHLEVKEQQFGPAPLENVIGLFISLTPCLASVPDNLRGQLMEDFGRVVMELGNFAPGEPLTGSAEYIWGMIEKI